MERWKHPETSADICLFHDIMVSFIPHKQWGRVGSPVPVRSCSDPGFPAVKVGSWGAVRMKGMCGRITLEHVRSMLGTWSSAQELSNWQGAEFMARLCRRLASPGSSSWVFLNLKKS